MTRELYVVGNWKMHKTAREATDYIGELYPRVQSASARVYLAIPFTSIAPAARYAKGMNLVIGAQNMNDAKEGAFTGEITALMLKEAGAEFVILGHSERRHIFGETDEFIHKKVVRALQEDLQPIFCFGETLQERETGQTEEVIRRQLQQGLAEVPKEDARKILFAYEPVWAIGTGQTATAEMAQEAHAFSRSILAELFGKKQAAQMPILYGGSVRPENAGLLTAEKDIDGVLVGGASLDPESFAEITIHCERKK